MSEEITEGEIKADERNRIITGLGIFVAVVFPVVMFAPILVLPWDVSLSLEIVSSVWWAAIVLGLMCVWFVLCLKSSDYVLLSFTLIAMIGIVAVFCLVGVYYLR